MDWRGKLSKKMDNEYYFTYKGKRFKLKEMIIFMLITSTVSED